MVAKSLKVISTKSKIRRPYF